MSHDASLAREYSTDEIIEALVEAKGNLAYAARKLGCWRSTIYRRLHKEEAIREAYNDLTEQFIDEAESRLNDMVEDRTHRDHFQAVRFALRTKGRMRGYGDRVELAGDRDAPLSFTFIPYRGEDEGE